MKHYQKQWPPLNLGVLLVIVGLLSSPFCVANAGVNPKPPPVTLQLPGGSQGIDFDSLRYFAGLHKLAVPAAQTGDLDLIDPKTKKDSVIANVAKDATSPHGDDKGATSVAYGAGYLFVNDHGRSGVTIINPRRKTVVARVKLSMIVKHRTSPRLDDQRRGETTAVAPHSNRALPIGTVCWLSRTLVPDGASVRNLQ